MTRKTYTCEKCAKVFKQKSHFTDHQRRKNDCSTSTHLSQLVEEKVNEIIEEKIEHISVNVIIKTGETFEIVIDADSGLNGLYEEMCDVLPLSYMKKKMTKEWFNFRRILSVEDVENGYRHYDFYNKMRNGERILLTFERPKMEHIVDIRPFKHGGVIGGRMACYKNIDKEFVTHYGYFYHISDVSIKKKENIDEKKDLIIMFQQTSLYPTVQYLPIFELGKNVNQNKIWENVNKFYVYTCKAHKLINPMIYGYDQSLEWKETIEDALSNIDVYDETFYTTQPKKRTDKNFYLTDDAIKAMVELYHQYKLTGKNNI